MFSGTCTKWSAGTQGWTDLTVTQITLFAITQVFMLVMKILKASSALTLLRGSCCSLHGEGADCDRKTCKSLICTAWRLTSQLTLWSLLIPAIYNNNIYSTLKDNGFISCIVQIRAAEWCTHLSIASTFVLFSGVRCFTAWRLQFSEFWISWVAVQWKHN